MRVVGWIGAITLLGGCAGTATDRMLAYRIDNDAIRDPLVSTPGDAGRGREILRGRDGNCLLCHAVPETGAQFMGNLAPALSGVGARWNAGQLRLRIVDPMRLNRNTIMPSYYRTDALAQVATPYRGKPILTAQQVEDVVAYLLTLR